MKSSMIQDRRGNPSNRRCEGLWNMKGKVLCLMGIGWWDVIREGTFKLIAFGLGCDRGMF
jgi:hypothetical protein